MSGTMSNQTEQEIISGQGVLKPSTREFYCRAITALKESGPPFLVGGAYAFNCYTGVERHTKDFDVFVRPEDADRTFEVLDKIGCQTDLTFPHWLGKAFHGDDFVDIIFSSGNGVATVDDEWFERAIDGEVLGIAVKLVPPEEMIWSKAFVMERERYDGADIAHVLRARAASLDWRRLLDRFGEHWRVLFSHIVMFGYIYPSSRSDVPEWVMRELLGRFDEEQRSPPPREQVCQGTLISRAQYLVDIDDWGYRDARLAPHGSMSRRDTAHWTAAIDNEK